MKKVNFQKIEKKWQKRWEKEKIFEANPDLKRKKFFLTVPYPYTSGPLHIGHGRTYTIGDIIARAMRMKGFNVLWPMAFHITGTPILAISAKIKKKDKYATELFKEYVGLYEKDPKKIEEIVNSFKEPWNVAKFFSSVISQDFRALGLSIDWRRKFTTGDPEYNKLIEWQFRNLREKGYIIQGNYPILFCLRCDNAVGEDDIIAGPEIKPKVGEFILIKYRLEDHYLVTATMRPETIFGVTNIWINPKEDYVKAVVDGEKWIISEKAVEKLEKQGRRIEIREKLKGKKLVGCSAKTPLTEKEILILPAEFVNADEASGIVYSVPAHAPWDWIGLKVLQEDPTALKEYKINPEKVKEIKPISMITVKSYGEFPAIEECQKFDVKNLKDREKIDKATENLYKNEFYNGILKPICKVYKGLNVQQAKERVFEDLRKNGQADKMYEVMALKKPVECRCGGKVIVAILQDQWFIDYGNEEWKDLARQCLASMKIRPKNYRKLFEDTLEWLHERPCARKRGLGTALPWDKNWIIESLSDSTIYMCFYTLIHHIRESRIKSEQLTDEFWDFVLLGKGDSKNVAKSTGINEELIEKMKDEFDYWYPNDQRHTAVGHITNHLSFFIFNHAGMFDKKKWPRIISINEYLIREGAKMSKSKGNVIPLVDIPRKYCADLYRLFIAYAADLTGLVDWREEEIKTVRGKLNRFFDIMKDVKRTEKVDVNELDSVSRWFVSETNRKIRDATDFIDGLEIRKYIQISFFEIFNDLNNYLRRMEDEVIRDKTLSYFSDKWVRLLAPVIPHLCEELWEIFGNKSFVSLAEWPKIDEDLIDKDILGLEEIFKKTLDDINHVIKIAGKKDSLYLYLSTKKEFDYFKVSLKFLKEQFKFKKVELFVASDPKRYDPQKKAEKAKYRKPGIYLE